MTKVKIIPVEAIKGDTHRLKYTEYSDYFDAIVSNNDTFVESLLSTVKPNERDRLTNTEFDLKDVLCPFFRSQISKKDTAIVLPLHIAVTNHSLDVARVLIKYGANLLKTDCDGNNVFHACVINVFYAPERENDTCTALGELIKEMPAPVLTKLLRSENKTRYRPLEYAAQQEALQLMGFFCAAMGSDMVTRTEQHGMTKYTWFDITEYETERHFRSPLVLFTYLDRARVKEKAKYFIDCPVFGPWLRTKFRLNVGPIIIWFILRATFLLSYFVVDRTDSWKKQLEELMPDNITHCYEDSVSISNSRFYIMATFLGIYASISILSDIVETVHMIATKSYTKMKNLNGWKDLIVRFRFYRMCTFLVSISVLVATGLSMKYKRVEDMSETVFLVLCICRVVIPVSACWSLMYFLQMLPCVGKSIVAIQGMLFDMANFLVIWCLILIPFMHTFQIFVTFNSNQGCIEDFQSFWSTFYTLFRMMINMVDLTQYDIKNTPVIYIMHMAYVFLVAIILINFLIALMSASATRIEENKLIIEWLNCLAIAVTLQERFGGWLLKPYYRYMMRRVFVTDHRGRLCIVTHTSRRDELKEKGLAQRKAKDGI